jgi:hypothetical protein
MQAVFDGLTDRPLGGHWANGHADPEAGGKVRHGSGQYENDVPEDS